jgi:hypothetical protein
MPTFAVHIKVEGPIRDETDGKRFDGAYSERYVVAADERAAEQRAVEGLHKEPLFAQLKLVDGIGAPPTEVDEVRQVRWYEGLFSKTALVFIRKPKTAPSEPKPERGRNQSGL